MFNQMVSKLKEKLKLDTNQQHIIVLNNQKIPIEPQKFTYFDASLEKKPRMVFIDGGCGELFSSSDFCLMVIRVASVWYKNKKRVKHELQEFFVLLDYDSGDGESVRVQFFGGSADTTTAIQKKLGNIVKKEHELVTVGTNIMQLAEIIEIGRVLDGLSEEDVIVRDGSLDLLFAEFADLQEKIKQKKVFVAGLCKTTRIRTTGGQSAVFVLQKCAEHKEWFYNVTKQVFFTKLHQRSRYTFRCDVVTPHYHLFDAIASHASDPTFLGYPYGLIEADRLARVSNQESVFLRKKIKMRLGEDARELQTVLTSSTAHDVLDQMVF
jgi:hypothetical protein